MGLLCASVFDNHFLYQCCFQNIRLISWLKNINERTVKNGNPLPQISISIKDNINSGIVNDLFYLIFVHAKNFFATGDCISCSKCVNMCPLNNIQIENGLPVWGNSCTHCMACICHCPKEAIEYGKHSRGLIRYTCKKEI